MTEYFGKTTRPTAAFAKEVVAKLPDSEMNDYVADPDKWLFAHYLCEAHDFRGNDSNTDVFEIALDNRATAEFNY